MLDIIPIPSTNCRQILVCRHFGVGKVARGDLRVSHVWVNEVFTFASISTLESAGIRSSGIGILSLITIPLSTIASCFMFDIDIILSILVIPRKCRMSGMSLESELSLQLCGPTFEISCPLLQQSTLFAGNTCPLYLHPSCVHCIPDTLSLLPKLAPPFGSI